ncbi:MAG: calcium/sodium antiporter [Oscillospiraceae bacterium]|nr:calcium/sodium antiporter [Oscillospiraceae bacterium]
MIINTLLALFGFIVLIKCADFFVDGAVSFARNLKIPSAVIGLTIVSFGTSAPELAIAFRSHLSGNPDMVIGGAVGSNIANILLILGTTALFYPFKIDSAIIKKELPLLFLITVAFAVIFFDNIFDVQAVNTLTRADGVVLLLFFSIFGYYMARIISNGGDKNSVDKAASDKPRFKVPMSVIMLVLGLGGVILGSELVVSNVTALAEKIGISQKIISVTVIAIGTSLPELVTTFVAAKKGETGIAVGNIIGSNIFNICIVLGLPVLILGDVATAAFSYVDVAFMLFAVLLLWVFSATEKKIRRSEAAVLLAAYCGYGVVMFVT